MGTVDMHRYELRYFFDPGSGICLWSENEMARDKFGYPVELASLNLPHEVASRAADLITLFDSSIASDDPAGPSPWTEGRRAQFAADARQLLALLQKSLGPDFAIRDCVSEN